MWGFILWIACLAILLGFTKIAHAMNRTIPVKEWSSNDNPFEQKKAEAIR